MEIYTHSKIVRIHRDFAYEKDDYIKYHLYMKGIVCFMILLCTCTYINSQTSRKELLNKMNFTDESGWSVGLKRFDARIRVDSASLYKGKHPLQIQQYNIAGFYPILHGILYNTFILPVVDKDSMTISLTCKSQNLESAYLVMSGISEKERVLYSDTLSVNGYNDWHTFQKNVSLRDVAIMELAIVFAGIDTLRFPKRKEEKVESLQNLWLDRIKMKVGKKDLADCPISPCSEIALSYNNVINGDSLLNQDLNYGFKNKKIVAFGESVHGSATINEKVIQLLKHGIEYDGRRLILMELPLEKMLYVNRFIQGDSAFCIDSISPYFEQSLYSDAWIDFFVWLKKYNAKVKNKVWLLGIDYENEYLFTELDLFEYLVAVNRTISNPDIAEFCRMLLLPEKNLVQKKMAFLQSHNCFKNEIGLHESKIIEHCLQTIIQARNQPVLGFSLRDKVMFDNLDFLFNLFSEKEAIKTAIYSHFGHANHSSLETRMISEPPFGFLAKQIYGDDFFVIGIFVGGGETLNEDRGKKWNISYLKENLNDTFEYWLSQVSMDYFYVPKTFLPSYLMRYRNIGAAAKEFSSLMNPSCRMDGALFIRKSKCLRKLSFDIDSERFSFISRFKRCLDESRKTK